MLAPGRVFRMWLCLVQGIGSGAGFAMVTTLVAAWFSSSGSSIAVVGGLTLLQQPYVIKFLWAPWVDRCVWSPEVTQRHLSACCLLIMSVLALSLAFFSTDQWPIIFSLLSLFVFVSATYDLVTDGARVLYLPNNESGLGASFAVVGFRVGLLCAAVGLLFLVSYTSWPTVFLVLAMLFLVLAVTLWVIAPQVAVTHRPMTHTANVFADLRSVLAMPRFWPLSVFVFVYKMAEAVTTTSSPILMPFFLNYLHFNLSEIAAVNKLMGLMAILCGSLISGVMLLNISLFLCLLSFSVLQLLMNAGFIALALLPKSYGLFAGVVFLENFAAGLGMTALVALLMHCSPKRFAATYFSFFTAVSALPRVFSGPISAWVVGDGGDCWVRLFVASTLLASLAPLLVLLQKKDIVSGFT